MTLPTWLTPGTLAACDRTLFAVAKVQQAKPPNRGMVLVAGNGDRHPLDHCHPARMAHLPRAARFVDAAGSECLLTVVGDTVILSHPTENLVRRVRLPGLAACADVDAVVRGFAAAFDGAIVEGDCDE